MRGQATTAAGAAAEAAGVGHDGRPQVLGRSSQGAGAVGQVPAAPADWVILAEPRDKENLDRPLPVLRVVFPVVVIALVVAVVVAIAGSLASRRIAEQQAVHDVTETANLIADSAVAPVLTNSMLTDPAEARRVLDPVIRRAKRTASLVRVKIWRPDGTVLYSDEPRLIGARFPLEESARSSLVDKRAEAGISDLDRRENRFERGDGKLLEVYRPIWTPSGQPLLFETYFRYDTVSERTQQLWRGFAGVMISSLAALVLLLAPVGWLLAARSRRARAQREQLMRRALDASAEERRRIAATLHDGVVQQLVAASLSVAGQEARASSAGDGDLAGQLRSVAETIRGGVAGLRSLLVDIYPASLHSAGLANALADLTKGAAGRGPEVKLDLDAVAAECAPQLQQEVIFRIAQEALRNALQHAGAQHVTLRLAPQGGEATRLDVHDDGHGFEPAGARADGHFGLSLMADAARHGGGWLGLRTSPGSGTLVRYEAAEGAAQ
jgi:two-component system, NarL family, sensor kinase